jgi:hypothetical protein
MAKMRMLVVGDRILISKELRSPSEILLVCCAARSCFLIISLIGKRINKSI